MATDTRQVNGIASAQKKPEIFLLFFLFNKKLISATMIAPNNAAFNTERKAAASSAPRSDNTENSRLLCSPDETAANSFFISEESLRKSAPSRPMIAILAVSLPFNRESVSG
jgi:hypothetical protein